MKKIIFITCLLFLFLTSCSGRYEKNGDTWSWITTNEGGQNTKELVTDLSTFEVLDDETYAKDKHHVFRKGSIIEGADPKTFEVISSTDYAKDAAHVYFNSFKIIHADPQSF